VLICERYYECRKEGCPHKVPHEPSNEIGDCRSGWVYLGDRECSCSWCTAVYDSAVDIILSNRYVSLDVEGERKQ